MIESGSFVKNIEPKKITNRVKIRDLILEFLIVKSGYKFTRGELFAEAKRFCKPDLIDKVLDSLMKEFAHGAMYKGYLVYNRSVKQYSDIDGDVYENFFGLQPG